MIVNDFELIQNKLMTFLKCSFNEFNENIFYNIEYNLNYFIHLKTNSYTIKQKIKLLVKYSAFC